MKIAVLKEEASGETRIAVSPQTAKFYCESGCDLVIQSGAGLAAGWPDSVYQEVGARIEQSAEKTVHAADLCLKIRPPNHKEVNLLTPGCALLALFSMQDDAGIIAECAKKRLDVFSLSHLPRISRAQAMDVLSSQANLAGYRAVIEAAYLYPGVFPMLMTAAGAIAPAKVFIMGVGVAGLQAIATARRLGAVVSATDVRPATKEQVASLGAKFIAVEDEEFKQAETKGGHAKAMSAHYQKKQAACIKAHLKDQDIVITTALIPGKKAPLLIDQDMLKEMKYGSLVIDLAVSQGGNVYGVKADCDIDLAGVKLLGFSSLPTRIPKEASLLFANNVWKYFSLLCDDNGTYAPDWQDEIIQATRLAGDGKILQ